MLLIHLDKYAVLAPFRLYIPMKTGICRGCRVTPPRLATSSHGLSIFWVPQGPQEGAGLLNLQIGGQGHLKDSLPALACSGLVLPSPPHPSSPPRTLVQDIMPYGH